MYQREHKEKTQQEGIRERKRRRAEPRAPILNMGRMRIDWPTRDPSPANLLKFTAFVAALLALFYLLYNVQARWLTAVNSRAQTPTWSRPAPPP